MDSDTVLKIIRHKIRTKTDALLYAKDKSEVVRHYCAKVLKECKGHDNVYEQITGKRLKRIIKEANKLL